MRPTLVLAGARRRTASLAMGAIVAACSGDGSPAPIVVVPTRIAFATQPDSAIVGDTVALGATTTDASGRRGTIGTLTFTTSDTTVARVSRAGVVRFVGAGSAVVTAQVNGLPGGASPLTLATPTLVSLAPAARLRVLPTRIDAVPGEQVALSATVFDSTGNRIAYPVTYASDNTAVAALVGGTVTAGTAGSAQIAVRASFRGRGVGQMLPVTIAPVAQSAFHIDLVQVGVVDPRYAAVFTRAAEFWQSVITASLPSQPLDLAAGSCGDGTPALSIQSTGVTIFFRVDSIDGTSNILGAAGPCVLRTDPATQLAGLPVVGTMRFDSADFSGLVNDGTAYDVIRHEMGHVLGIGTLWNVAGGHSYLTNDGTLDPEYAGPQGEAGSATLGFTLDGSTVPVENVGGAGTAGAHWRSSVFRSELMTGYLAQTPTHPASRLTILSLADLGYSVNVAGSEPLLPPSTSDLAPPPGPVAARAFARTPARTDVALPPLYRVARGRSIRSLRGALLDATARRLR
ncbi:MAG TPA: leishmanolysin-related zinc metalloendopeptidase [Gemmatirosa sp.]